MQSLALDKWLEMTIQMQLWAVPIILLSAIGFLIGSILFILRYRKAAVRVAELQTQVAALHQQKVQLTSKLDGLQSQLSPLITQEKLSASTRECYSNFIHNISHDMRTPLQSIQTTLDNMVKSGPTGNKHWRQHHAIVASEIQWFFDLIGKLSQLSHLETPESPLVRESVNLKGVIEYAIMTLGESAEEQGIEVSYEGPERLPRVFGDRHGLRQVFMNLVQNGIKYAKPEGGDVVVRVERGDVQLHIQIMDNGIGIAPEVLPLIFDTAYRAPDVRNFRRKGSGLGLAITKRIVEQHDGTVQVQSTLGEGTTFSFDLPLYRSEE